MKEMQEIVFAVRQMEQKSDFERDKIRADQLMEKENIWQLFTGINIC